MMIINNNNVNYDNKNNDVMIICFLRIQGAQQTSGLFKRS